MQFRKRQGETTNQIARRANDTIEGYQKIAAEAIKVRDLAISKTDTINPRTKRSYKTEAELMFSVIAMIEHAHRTQQEDHVLTFVRETLELMGFDMVQMYENKAMIDKAYNETK